MINSYKKITAATLYFALPVMCLCVFQGQLFPMGGRGDPLGTSLSLCLLALAVTVYGNRFFVKHIGDWITCAQEDLEKWLQSAPQAFLKTGVIVVAGLTLFLELVLIRWQTGLFPIFALYKNFILLSCFCGIGLGYALSRMRPLLLPATLPLLAISVLFFLLLLYGMDSTYLLFLLKTARMETEILRLGFFELGVVEKIFVSLPALAFLAVSFVLNTLVVLPVAQLCGAMMERIETPLTSYGCNLLGSIAGVLALFVVSLFWVGPVVWFAVVVGILLFYQMKTETVRNSGIVCAVLIVASLAWPAEMEVQKIYSPYQLIQKSVYSKTGLTWFVGSGSYHQHAHDNSTIEQQERKPSIGFFEVAYRNAPSLENVLIIGSGIGNDVASALRNHAGSVDAVEIDPAIIAIGRKDHPEHPYQDERVNAIADDGRGFVRSTEKQYDLITYGLQDTTILMSYGTNVRFDTFLFTKQGLEDSYSRLKPGGVMSMGFMFPKDVKVGHKIYRIMEGLPGASAPVAIKRDDLSEDIGFVYVNFMVRKGAEYKIPASYLSAYNQIDISSSYKNSRMDLTLPSDDWPFFLMEEKTFPVSYILSSLLVLLLSGVAVRSLLPDTGMRKDMMPFFFLGAGFMLVETKAISELALVFGNTWQVVAITITGVLIMAYLANLFVAATTKSFSFPAFIGLCLFIIGGYFMFINGDMPYRTMADKVLAVSLLVSPLFFSGILFSSLFKKTDNVGSAMAYNIMGAMLGGLLEYNAMLLGLSSLYLVALAAYILAGITALNNFRTNH